MGDDGISEELAGEIALDIIEPGAGQARRVLRSTANHPPSLVGIIFSLLSTMIAPILAIFGILFAVVWAIDSDNKSEVDLSENQTNSTQWMAAARGWLITIPITIIPVINLLAAIIGPGYAAAYHQRPALEDGRVDYELAARVGMKTFLIPFILASPLLLYVWFSITGSILVINSSIGIIFSIIILFFIILSLVLGMVLGSIGGMLGVRFKS